MILTWNGTRLHLLAPWQALSPGSIALFYTFRVCLKEVPPIIIKLIYVFFL